MGKMIFVFIIVMCFARNGFLTTVADDEQVKYYMKILAEGTTNANNFVLPTDNRRYFGDKIPDESEAKDLGEYDFIIVGAGSSGSVVINRLAQVGKWNILVLEAGGNETEFTDVPSMMFYTHLSENNWGYNTTSQRKSCLGMNNNQCVYPRGRVLGGSGTINALMYVRGNKNDYDRWEEQGNPGWSYESLLPYFKKSEHFEVEDGDIAYHSTTGLWNVSSFKPITSLTDNILQAMDEMGSEYVDYNGKNQMGYSKLQMNINKGKRASGGRNFINPIRNNPYVNIVTNALVTKILINTSNSAHGVIFLKDKTLYKATVNKEVVVSAGAINTPQLLMLSGIGPKQHLDELKIPLIKDLPVGKYFHDHPFFFLNIRTNTTFNRSSLPDEIKNLLQGTGLLTYCANTQVIKFVNTLDPKSTVPDIEYIFVPPPSTSDLASKVYNFRPEVIDATVNKQNQSTDLKILLVLLHPKSSGEVTLKSNNALDFPNIDTSYFTDPEDEDVETIYRGVLYALTMLDTNTFKRLNATLQLDFPLCDHHKVYSRDYWHCVIRYLSSTLYHASGTARMGPDPNTSVVDNELKVYGIDNLRVADCSIIPSSTSGHTNAPAFMIGEKLAVLLKQRYQ